MDSSALKLTPSESVSIRHSDADRLEVVVTYGPHGDKPPAHYHPAQDEHFEVLEGELHARVEGEDRVLRAGDTLDIPRGAVHQMWNPGNGQVRATWVTSPAGRTEHWFRAIDALHRAGRVDKNGMPGPLAFGVLLTEYDDVFRLAARPRAVIRAALAGAGAIGRRRGYSAQAPAVRSTG
jgi:quercetin dioxygenase-like cupin family protein